MNLSYKSKILVTVSVIAVTTATIVYIIILPAVSDIRKISASIVDQRVDLEKKYQRGQLLRKTVKDFELVKPQRQRLTSVFIRQGEELDFITLLEKVASTNNINQQIKLEIDDPNIAEYPLNLSIQGQFNQIMNYMADLEKIDLYFNISSLTMTATGPFASQLRPVAATLNGKLFVIPADKDESENEDEVE